jgi:spermidine synthase
LGFGYTLRAALAALPPNARVEVVELSEAVIRWNRDPSLPLAREALADPRVRLHHADVGQVLARVAAVYDAIMLDVDNGPAALSQEANDKLYREIGVQQAVGALKPGGCIAYWSATDDAAFAKLLGRTGVKVETHKVRAVATSGGKHTIFTGRMA